MRNLITVLMRDGVTHTWSSENPMSYSIEQGNFIVDADARQHTLHEADIAWARMNGDVVYVPLLPVVRS